MKKLGVIIVVLVLYLAIAGCNNPVPKEEWKIITYMDCSESGGAEEEIPGLSEYYQYGTLVQKEREPNVPFEEENLKGVKNIVINDINISVEGTYSYSQNSFGLKYLSYTEKLPDRTVMIGIRESDNSLLYYQVLLKKSFYPSDEQLQHVYTFDDCYKIALEYAEKYSSHRDDMVLELSDSNTSAPPVEGYHYESYTYVFEWKYNGITVSDVRVGIDNFGTIIEFSILQEPVAELFLQTKHIDIDKHNDLVNEELQKVISCADTEIQYELVSQCFLCDDVRNGYDSAYILSQYALKTESDGTGGEGAILNIEVPVSMIK